MKNGDFPSFLVCLPEGSHISGLSLILKFAQKCVSMCSPKGSCAMFVDIRSAIKNMGWNHEDHKFTTIPIIYPLVN